MYPKAHCASVFWKPHSLSFHKNGNGNALLYVKNVFVLGTVRSVFLFTGVAVQVKEVYFVKSVHQRLTHSTKGGVIKIAVIRDKPEDASANLVNFPLGKPDELDVVILKPLRVLLAKGFPINLFYRFEFDL